MRIYLELDIRRIDCGSCQGVKQEKLDWLADNPFYTKRFAFYIGRRCRSSSIQDVAKEHFLDWRTVKTLEMQYMREQIKRAGEPRPKVIGIDEIWIGKGQTYRIVVSDLDRRRAIGSGVKIARRRAWICSSHFGREGGKRVRLAVMDMWKPYRKSTDRGAKAAILFDKFHILRHLGEALDKVGKQEYAKLDGEKPKFIKGQKYALLSHRRTCRVALERTSGSCWPRQAARYRLRAGGVLGQLWDYDREAWARKLFENWRDQLKWKSLKPYESFAEMIDARWDGIAAYCKPENKVLWASSRDSTTRYELIRRRAYGIRDEEYLRLKDSVACCRKSRNLSRRGRTTTQRQIPATTPRHISR